MVAASSIALALPLPARASSQDTRVGVNVPDIAPGRGAGVVFVDAMKQAAPWSSDRRLILDPNGNVRFLARGQVAQTVVFPGETYPAGRYVLLYDGAGAFDLSGAGAVVARGAGRIVVRIVPQAAGIRLRLTATQPCDPVRNVRLILPGFEQTYASAPYSPGFIQTLRSFNVLRFKDWMHGDTFVSSAVWPARPSATRATQVAPEGVAPEYMVALANATGADPWFTIPLGATDMYVYQFAALVHQMLDPRLHPTFEYGHEVWKAGTPANAYAAMAGRNFRLAADPATAALDWYAQRSTQMFALVRRAFGADARRVDGVVSGPFAVAPNDGAAAIDRTILQYARAGAHADAFAVSVPSDGEWSRRGALTTQRLVAQQNARLPLIAYDGGDALEAWHADGGGLFVSHSDAALPSTTAGRAELLGIGDYQARHPASHPAPASPSRFIAALSAPRVARTTRRARRGDDPCQDAQPALRTSR